MVFFFTENNKVFFTGRNAFGEDVSFLERFWNLGNGARVSKKPFELEAIAEFAQDEQGNFEELVDIRAGDEHFVVLTGESNRKKGYYCLLTRLLLYRFGKSFWLG